MAGDWTDEQNDEIVADYLAMPGAEWQLRRAILLKFQLLGNPMLSQTI
ncbi:hypothetical protein [Mesorhizobium sp. M1396]